MKFRKKPVVIDAVQWTGGNLKEMLDFTAGQSKTIENGELVIHTLEGDMLALPNDWIIKGVQGEFYPCKPDIFAETYEDASAPVADEWQQRWDCLAESVANVREHTVVDDEARAWNWVLREMAKMDPRAVPETTVHQLAIDVCRKLLTQGFGGIKFYDAAVAPLNSLEDYDYDLDAWQKHCHDYAIFTVEYDRPMFDDFDDSSYISTPSFDEMRFEADLVAFVQNQMGEGIKVTYRSGCSEFECERK